MSLKSAAYRVLAFVMGVGCLAAGFDCLKTGTFRLPLVRHVVHLVYHRATAPAAFYAFVGLVFAIGGWLLVRSLMGLRDDDLD